MYPYLGAIDGQPSLPTRGLKFLLRELRSSVVQLIAQFLYLAPQVFLFLLLQAKRDCAMVKTTACDFPVRM